MPNKPTLDYKRKMRLRELWLWQQAIDAPAHRHLRTACAPPNLHVRHILQRFARTAARPNGICPCVVVAVVVATTAYPLCLVLLSLERA